MIKFGFWVPPIGLAILIFVFSNMPKPPSPDLGVEFGDKIIHFLVYMLLSTLLALAINGGKKHQITKKKLAITIMLTSFYGLTDEVHQFFVQGRNSDIWDWLADTFGGIAGAYIFLFINKIGERNNV